MTHRKINIVTSTWAVTLFGTTNKQSPLGHCRRSDDDTGNSVWKPMWLIVIGDRRQEISPLVAYSSFRQRFDIEHMFL
ncbi:MAG: hypothetical protein DSM106950_32485 [Stigonema ocellatum SAG 48.90 = DSM 106950]|nr:hypothetical protein [Stigonema ocellatum SAG 48.90 = DSM 106950]